VTSISNCPPYDALSYTWDQQAFDRPAYCDGEKTFVTRNIESAMHKLRGRAPWSKAYLIWIDALCINQSSVSEKNRQVAMMGEIYSRAHKVVVWLSYDDSSAATLGPTEQQLRRVFRRIRDVAAETKKVLGGDDQDTQVISELPNHRYWTRIWTVQELSLAKSFVVYVGGFGPLAGSALRDAIVGPGYPFRLRGNWATARLHLDLPHPTNSYLLPAGKSGAYNRHGVVLGLVSKDASDKRDLVFALRAVAPDILGGIPVDYDVKIDDLFVRVTKELLCSGMILDILFLATLSDWRHLFPSRYQQYPSRPARTRPNVRSSQVDYCTRAPSWVPNWATIPWDLGSRWHMDRGLYAPGRDSVQHIIKDDNTLSIRVCIFG